MVCLQKEGKEHGPVTSSFVNCTFRSFIFQLYANKHGNFNCTHFDPEDVLQLLRDGLEQCYEALALHLAEDCKLLMLMYLNFLSVILA